MAAELYTAELIRLNTAATAMVDQLEKLVGRMNWLDNELLCASVHACDEDEHAGEVVYAQMGGGLMDRLLQRLDVIGNRIDIPA